ncbi:cytochrome P450 [Flagelloscypha sp. PMI_526]|nr:cytochrome P450 [Flagelloscypha sp. PMI_526]
MHWSYIVGSLFAHLVFNRHEPPSLKARFSLLLGIPILNSLRIHGFDLLALLNVISIHNAVLLGSIFLYRRNPRHPLATYPGPFLASLSNLWMVYQVSGGKRHVLLIKLHQKYGTHVRIGPNALSIVDVDAIKTLLYDPQVPRSSAARAIEPDHMPPNVLSARTITYPDHLKVHADQRKRWSKAFTSTALDDFSVPLTARLVQLIDKFKTLAESQSEVDLDEWFKHFVWDFMGDLVFGGGFSMMEDGEDKSGYQPIVEQSLVWVLYFLEFFYPEIIAQDSDDAPPHALDKQLPTTARLKLSNSLRNASLKGAVDGWPLKTWFTSSYGVILLSGSTSIIQGIQAKEDEPEHLRPSTGAIVNDAFLGIIAGSDTTVNSFSSLFFLLLSHPDKLAKLREEIDSLDEGELNNLSRGQTSLLECLHLNRASTGKVIGDRFVPYGTTVYMPTFLLGRDPRYFYPEPTSFWPERWLSEERKANPDIIHNTHAFVPFGAGVAMCLGKRLAYRELRLGTALLIRNFNMELILKEDTVRPPGTDEVLFKKARDWGILTFDKGLIKPLLQTPLLPRPTDSNPSPPAAVEMSENIPPSQRREQPSRLPWCFWSEIDCPGGLVFASVGSEPNLALFVWLDSRVSGMSLATHISLSQEFVSWRFDTTETRNKKKPRTETIPTDQWG